MHEHSRDGSRNGRRPSSWVRRHAAGLAVAAGLSAAAGLSSCGAREEEEPRGSLELAATATTASFQNGVLPGASYTGCDDATLRQSAASTNYGAATSCEADGDDGGGVDKSCLVKWALSGIPAGSVIQSATITLRVTNATSNAYGIYGVLRSWSEAQATWVNAATGAAWAGPGAAGASDRGAELGTITGSTGTRSVTLNAAGVALVQSWLDGGTNAGILIASASNTDGLDFASSEHATPAYHPRLDVTYLPPDAGGTGGASGTGGAASGGSSTGGVSGGTPGISTDPNLKIGFIGDTGTGQNFRDVLTLVKNEGSAALVVQGDMSYSDDPTAWWSDVESVLGTSFPVFLSRGNHDDSSWGGYQAKAAQHLGGATRIAGAHDANYKTTFRGLVIATIRKGDTAARLTPFLQGDAHLWKICQWHQNQQAMQIGGKTDEMGWEVYETCRGHGAIIQTGHEHSYSRTKTLVAMSSQTVDPSCSGAASLCVGPGRTFANVVGLGGESVRPQSRCLPASPPYGCNGEWGSIYASNQNAVRGAQFIVFNDGAPDRATGYFKNVNGQTVDSFTIDRD